MPKQVNAVRVMAVLSWGLRWSAVLGIPAGEFRAAEWYFDNSAVESSNTGFDWANAWTNFDSVVWGSGGVQEGDTLFISGGRSSKVYTNSWTVGASGTASQPIRIAVDAGNSNHNGVVIFDYGFAGEVADLEAITCGRDYITFDGNVNGQRHMVIRNLCNYLDRFAAVGIYADSARGLTLDHLSFLNCNNPVYLSRGTEFKITGCELRQVRGDAAIAAAGCTGGWDANLVCSNVLEMWFNTAKPPGKKYYYGGPDGVQCSDGISIFGNTFIESHTSSYTSEQHPDMIQATGNFIKVYGNEFINVGDSVFDYDCFDNPDPHNVWIYNNVFRITQTLDELPEYFRLYASFNSISSISNFKILNNTFVDNSNWMAITFNSYQGSPAAWGNEIKNNIFYNCGQGPYRPVVNLDDSEGFSTNSFVFDGNVYYGSQGGVYINAGASYPARHWIEKFEPSGSTSQPAFASYHTGSSTNDYHLANEDGAAVNRGADLSEYFVLDKDGVSRLEGPGWDLGAYVYPMTGPGRSNLPPLLSSITIDLPDADPLTPGFQVVPGATTTFSAYTSDPEEDPVSWIWTYSVGGGAEVRVQSGVGNVISNSFTYPPESGGEVYTWSLEASDGRSTVTTTLEVNVLSLAPPPTDAITFQAEHGLLTGLFRITNGCIVQDVKTTAGMGGRAEYAFSITNAGDYAVVATAEAAGFGQRCLAVDIDGEPEDPAKTWCLALTDGFADQVASWRGAGGLLFPEFSPKFFNLSIGEHKLVLRGLDANVFVDRLTVFVVPEILSASVTNVLANGATFLGKIDPRDTGTWVYFEYGPTTNYLHATAPEFIPPGGEAVVVEQYVPGLLPSRTYFCRCVAFNRGVANPSPAVSFQTAAAPVLGPVVRANNEFSIDVPTAPFRMYFLERQADLGQSPWEVVDRAVGDGTTVVMQDPAALGPMAFYQVRVLNLPVIFTLPPTNLSFSTSILSAEVNPNEIPTFAFFEYGQSTNYGHVTEIQSLGAGNEFLVMTNLIMDLTPSTDYHFRIVAYNLGVTNSGPDFAFKTLPIPQPVVEHSAFVNGQFSVTFEALLGFTYTLEYTDSLPAAGWGGITNMVGAGTIITLTDPSTPVAQRFYRISVH